MSQRNFINITAYKTPLACANILHPYKVGKERISPEFCKELLKATNHHRIINDLTNLILEQVNQVPESYGIYESVLCGILEGREQPEYISQKIKSEIKKHNPALLRTKQHNKIKRQIKSSGIHEHIFNLSDLDYAFFRCHWLDYAGVNKVIFPKSRERLIWDRFKNLSGKIDLSENLDTTMLEIGGDLSSVQEIIFPSNITNIDVNYGVLSEANPKAGKTLYNFSLCDKLETACIYAKKETSLILASSELHTVYIGGENPETLDFSNCPKLAWIALYGKHLKEYDFPESLERLDFNIEATLPDVWDLRKCQKLNKLYISEHNTGASIVLLPESKRWLPDINIYGERNVIYKDLPEPKGKKKAFSAKLLCCIKDERCI